MIAASEPFPPVRSSSMETLRRTRAKYCNCANCGMEIETIWDADGNRVSPAPVRVEDRPLCVLCEHRFRDGEGPSFEHTLKVLKIST